MGYSEFKQQFMCHLDENDDIEMKSPQSDLTNNQKNYLRKVVSGRWVFNRNTGLVDVTYGNVEVSSFYYKRRDDGDDTWKSRGEIPVKFGKVNGDFKIHPSFHSNGYNEDILEGCPYRVERDFRCYSNNVKTLKHAPTYIGGSVFYLSDGIQGLDWTPEHIGGTFHMWYKTVPEEYQGKIIKEVDELVERGIKLFKPEEYYSFKDAYYRKIDKKLIDVL